MPITPSHERRRMTAEPLSGSRAVRAEVVDPARWVCHRCFGRPGDPTNTVTYYSVSVTCGEKTGFYYTANCPACNPRRDSPAVAAMCTTSGDIG